MIRVGLMIALFVAGGAQAAPYPECINKEAQFYGAFCHALDDIRLAVRSACRPSASGLFENQVLDDGDKAALIEKYMDVMDERVTQIVLDFRIKNEINCGQFNDKANPTFLKK